MKITRTSVADRVAEQLRMRIIKGELLPGEKIVEEEFCNEMEISRTPLREAFRVLQVEGFLSYKPRCGVTVSSYSIEDVEELWDLRSVLESTASARVANNRQSDIIKNLACLSSGNPFIQEYDSVSFSKNDTRFHTTIANGCGNRWMETEIVSLWQKAAMPRRVLLYDIESAKQSCAEHELIVQRIKDGDCEGAWKAMDSHIKNSLERIKEKFDRSHLQ